ncbi:MAG: glycoside hydrolase family 88 protein [Candidatus Caldatribacteriaceae bacterium]
MHQEIVSLLVKKIETNLSRFSKGFPHVSFKGRYFPLENVEWTAGFWTGILWLAFLITGKKQFRIAAQQLLFSFENRLQQNIAIDTHDLGFLYLLSCVPDFEIFGSEISKALALDASQKLTERFHPQGKYIQAFGKVPPEENPITIIDSLMNLPLLYWASKKTGKSEYFQVAVQHAQTVRSLLVREDGSTYQACRFCFQDDQPMWLGTIQGYSNISCWSRGQAWAIYGFTLSYKYTKLPIFLDTALKVTEYFLNHLPEDQVCYFDLIFSQGDQPRDSSAAAIAVSGILELASVLETIDPEKSSLLHQKALTILQNLTRNYVAISDDKQDGFLLHATYHWPRKEGIDESCIWGDYFYLESLSKAIGSTSYSLWYYD